MLATIAEGREVERELLVALASSVMSERRVALALEVLGRGPHVLDRAIELATTMLGTVPAVDALEPSARG